MSFPFLPCRTQKWTLSPNLRARGPNDFSTVIPSRRPMSSEPIATQSMRIHPFGGAKLHLLRRGKSPAPKIAYPYGYLYPTKEEVTSSIGKNLGHTLHGLWQDHRDVLKLFK